MEQHQLRPKTRIPEVVLCLVLVLCNVRADLTDQTTLYDVIPPGSGSLYGAGHVVQYLWSGFNMEFNSARAVCRKLGGDIAKVDTEEKQAWIASLDGDNDPSTDPIFSKDHVWSGLTENVEGEHVWVADCSNDTSNVTFKSDWQSSEYCLIMENGKWNFEYKKCDENRAVLCELPVAITMANLSITWTYDDTDIPDDSCDPYAATTTSTTTTSTSTSTTTTTPTTTSTTTTTPTSTSTTTTTPTTTSTTTTTPTTTSTTTTSTTTTTPTTTSTTTSTPTTTSTTTTTPTTTTTTPTTTSTSTTTPTTTSTSTTTPTTTSTTTTTPTTTSTTTTVPTTTSTTTSTTSTTPTTPVTVTTTAANCCSCGNIIQNYTEAELESLVQEITKNLTVDAKATSSHRRSLTSAEDNRPSAVAVGTLGVLLIAALFAFIVLTDLTKIYQDCKRFHLTRNQCDDKTA